ncbi:MAG: archaellin/type IV pilin N-terminal domain-containing protein [Haloferacaceae archaeon]
MNRGQSSVIGVALLLAITVVAVAGMTATVGTVIRDRAATAGTDRVATAFDDALDPHVGGPGRDRIALPGGRLRVVERTLRVRRPGRTVAAYEVGGLVYTADDRSVTYLSGALVRSTPAGETVRGDLPVRASDGDVFVSAAILGTPTGRGIDADATTLRTNVTHDRRTVGPGDYRIAIETRAPDAWATRLDGIGRTSRTDFDDDGVPSVVVDPLGSGRIYLTIHRLRLEVTPA